MLDLWRDIFGFALAVGVRSVPERPCRRATLLLYRRRRTPTISSKANEIKRMMDSWAAASRFVLKNGTKRKYFMRYMYLLRRVLRLFIPQIRRYAGPEPTYFLGSLCHQHSIRRAYFLGMLSIPKHHNTTLPWITSYHMRRNSSILSSAWHHRERKQRWNA